MTRAGEVEHIHADRDERDEKGADQLGSDLLSERRSKRARYFCRRRCKNGSSGTIGFDSIATSSVRLFTLNV